MYDVELIKSWNTLSITNLLLSKVISNWKDINVIIQKPWCWHSQLQPDHQYSDFHFLQS